MRAIVQRVREAHVDVAGERIAEIQAGIVVLLGVHRDDGEDEARDLARRIPLLRIFPDRDGRMNCSLAEAGGEMLCVSQFTLWGDTAKGRRPSWGRAAPADVAEPLYEVFLDAVRKLGIRVETGRFGADMDVQIVNQGPVTLLVET